MPLTDQSETSFQLTWCPHNTTVWDNRPFRLHPEEGSDECPAQVRILVLILYKHVSHGFTMPKGCLALAWGRCAAQVVIQLDFRRLQSRFCIIMCQSHNGTLFRSIFSEGGNSAISNVAEGSSPFPLPSTPTSWPIVVPKSFMWSGIANNQAAEQNFVDRRRQWRCQDFAGGGGQSGAMKFWRGAARQ